MKKFLGSGGLGDMLICFSKCYNYVENDEKFHFTYIDNRDNRRTKIDYKKYAEQFLKYQNIDYNIIVDDQIEFYKNHHSEFDYCFSPQIYGKTHEFLKRPFSIDSNSKPYIDFKLPDLFDIHFTENKKTISIISYAGNGDDNRRSWSSNDFLQNLIKYLNVKLDIKCYLLGVKDDTNFEYCYNVRDLELCEQLVYLEQSDSVICFSGFNHLFSCFLNKKVIVKWENEAARDWYYHPEWLKNNVKFWYNESYSEIINLL